MGGDEDEKGVRGGSGCEEEMVIMSRVEVS